MIIVCVDLLIQFSQLRAQQRRWQDMQVNQLFDDYHRASRDPVEQIDNIVVFHAYATMRHSLPHSSFFIGAMDVNVAVMGIDTITPVHSRFHTIQPEYTAGD